MEKTTPGLRQQNPLMFYLHTLLYMLMALLVRIITFAPLATLFIPSDLPFWPWLSLLCPLLFIFLLLPWRFSFAQALVQNGPPRRFGLDAAFRLDQYGEKLWRSFVHFLSVLKWCLPLALYGLYGYSLKDLGLSDIMDQLTHLGLGVGDLVSKVVTFLRGLFGNITPLEIQGGWAEGLMALGAFLVLLLLVIAVGVMRNSATRYVWAYASRYHRNPSSENRRRVKNRRWAQLGFALVNLLLWAPFLAGLSVVFSGGLPADLSSQFLLLLSGQPMDMSFLTQKIGHLLLAFFLLYLPLLPLRRRITAFFATKSIHFVQPSPLSGPGGSKTEPPGAAAPLPGFAPLQEEDEVGLPPLAQSFPMPQPVPAWPAPQGPEKHTAPYQPSLEEQAPEAVLEAPGEEAPEAVAQAEPAAQQPAVEQPATEQPPAEQPPAEASQSGPEPLQIPGELPRQDVEPSAFTIGQ